MTRWKGTVLLMLSFVLFFFIGGARAVGGEERDAALAEYAVAGQVSDLSETLDANFDSSSSTGAPPVCSVPEAIQSELSTLRTQKTQLEKSLDEANEKIKDLQRAVERKKNEVVTAESVLKNCELDKTVLTENQLKHKDVAIKMVKDIEGLKTQLQLANQKCLQPSKCPPCPVVPQSSSANSCPICPAISNPSLQVSSTALLGDGKKSADLDCNLQLCTNLAIYEAKSASIAAYQFATVTVPIHWENVGKPFVRSAWEAFNSSSGSVIKPFYAEYVEPIYKSHVEQRLVDVWGRIKTIYDEHLAELVQLQVKPALEFFVSKSYGTIYTAYSYLDIEDLTQNLWLGFAKMVRSIQLGLQWATDAITAIDPRLASMAPVLVHAILLLILFVLRRPILGVLSLLVLILLSPLLLIVYLVTWPLRSGKSKSKNKKPKQVGPRGYDTFGPPLQPPQALRAGPAVGVGSSRSQTPPRPFPRDVQPQGFSGGEESQVWGDGEPLTTQGALSALRSYEESVDAL